MPLYGKTHAGNMCQGAGVKAALARLGRSRMDTDMLQSIYAHASWANEKLFDTAAELTQAQLTHTAGDAVSILDLLVHLVDVQRTWLARAQHKMVPPLDSATCSTLAALRDAWKSVDDASRMYVAELRADDLAEIVHSCSLGLAIRPAGWII